MTDILSLAADTGEAHARAERLFERVSSRIGEALALNAEIRHIGATAVPGCITKGDLDIVVRVTAADFMAADAALSRLFPRNTGSIRSDTFAAFADDAAEPALGVQLVVRGSEDDTFHLFAAKLAADPALVAAYNDLKRVWAGRAMDDYRAAKAQFIARVLEGA